MKILALDIGDVWVGIAISDPLGIIASPYTTVLRKDLNQELVHILQLHRIGTIVVGDPKTMQGTVSEQTHKTRDYSNTLRDLFPAVAIVLWDERLSSKRASQLKPGMLTKEQKRESHARAAAFILSSYLEHRRMTLTKED